MMLKHGFKNENAILIFFAFSVLVLRTKAPWKTPWIKLEAIGIKKQSVLID
jgi:hypothetical protein